MAFDPVLAIAHKIAAGATFKESEAFVAALSSNLSSHGSGLINIPLTNTYELIKWAPGESRWICVCTESKTIIGALIQPDDNCPAARFYFSSVEQGGLAALRKHLITEQAKDLEALKELGGSSGFVDRLMAYQCG